MIYIFAGNDTKRISKSIASITNGNSPTILSTTEATKEKINDLAESASLFGEPIIVITDNFIKSGSVSFNPKELTKLKDSPNIFIFCEDSILAAQKTKYAKYATIEQWEEKKMAKLSTSNTFALAQAFGNKDKMASWMLYRESIDQGATPEALLGMIFWKVKTLTIEGSSNFTKEELRKQSSELVSLYHRAHRGELDFVIGLEQFILTTLIR